MSMTDMSDVETAEMMLTLGYDESGKPLDDATKAELEAFIAEHKQPSPPTPTQQQPAGDVPDIQALIAAEVARQTGGAPQQQAPQASGLAGILKQIDPRDSESALAMFEWLVDNHRLSRIGMLDGGGYLLHYSEPKGTSKAGYTPGATKGGRMVDDAVDKARESGGQPRKTGLCDKCWSAVEQQPDGTVVTDDDAKNAACSAGGTHTFNA